MKTFNQFKLKLNEIKGLSNLVNTMRAGPAIKHLRTPFKNSVRMYHGTLKTASNKIMNKGFTPTQTVNPKTLSTELSNVYLTTNPKRAEHYANLMAKTKKGKPDIVAVNVNKTKNIRKGVRDDEFVVPVKDTIPTAQGVKPIKRRKGEVIQDNYQLKTYNQFITELNRFEAAMVAGKIGLKTLKKLGINTSGYNYMKAFGKGSINKNFPRVPKAELVGGLYNIGRRNLTSNPFTSMRRSAENQLRSYQILAPGQTGKSNTFRNKFGDELYYDTTLGRHTDLRNVGKKFNRQAYADMKHRYLDGDKNAKKVMDAIKDAGDANRQLSKPPLGTTPIGTRPNEMIKSSFPRTIEKRKMADLLNKEKLGIEPKYGDKPTTVNIKKGSIPEPKNKKNKK